MFVTVTVELIVVCLKARFFSVTVFVGTILSLVEPKAVRVVMTVDVEVVVEVLKAPFGTCLPISPLTEVARQTLMVKRMTKKLDRNIVMSVLNSKCQKNVIIVPKECT